MKATYSKPYLVQAARGWYAKYFYNGEEIRDRATKFRLNKINDLVERKKEFEFYCEALYKKLKLGHNPTLSEITIDAAVSSTEHALMPICDALDFALKQKENKAHKTYLDYACTIRAIKRSIESLSFSTMKIGVVKKRHVKIILERAQKNEGWSNHGFNKNKTNLSAVVSELEDYEVYEVNPVAKIKDKDHTPTGMHAPATVEEYKIIIKALEPHNRFMDYCRAIWHTLCREVELLRVRVWMVNLERREIFLPAEITKGRKVSRIVPINDFLYEILLSMEITSVPGDYFLFGTFKEPRNNGKKHDHFLVPAPFEVHRNRVTELWKLLIKDGCGLKVTLYSQKRGGVDALQLQGADIDDVRQLAGHTDSKTTKIYSSVHDGIQRKKIQGLGREFGDLT